MDEERREVNGVSDAFLRVERRKKVGRSRGEEEGEERRGEKSMIK